MTLSILFLLYSFGKKGTVSKLEAVYHVTWKD